MHAIVTKILVQVLDSKIYIRQKRVLELAMTRAGRAMGWKSRGLAKDSEEGKRGALEGKEGNGGGQCQEGGQKPNWRDLLRPPEAAATTWVLPNTQAC